MIIVYTSTGEIVRYGNFSGALNVSAGESFLTVSEFNPVPPKRVDVATQTVVLDDAVDASTAVTWDSIRMERDSLISVTDWVVLPDAKIAKDLKAEVVAYRQGLRDITKTYATPAEVVFPMSPLVSAAIVKKYGISVGNRDTSYEDLQSGNVATEANIVSDANTVTEANTVSEANTVTESSTVSK